MRSDEFDLAMDDGVTVHVRRWQPETEPRAVVQVTHGMTEHTGRYGRFAAALVADGYAVWAHDHRGHGGTAPAEADLGYFADEHGFDRIVSDLLAVRAEIGRQGGEGAGRQVALFAHSMGSFITQSALAQHPPSAWDAVILAGSDTPGGPPTTAFHQVAKLERLRLGKRGRSTLLDKLAFGPFNRAFRPTRTGSDWLTRDTAEVDQYLADPRTGFLFTTQAWVDFMSGRCRIASTGFGAVRPKDLPILLLTGERDPVGRMGKGVPQLAGQLREAGLTDVQVITYPGARHELLNETNRDLVVADIQVFLARTIG